MRRFVLPVVIVPVLVSLYAYAGISLKPPSQSNETCPIVDPGPPAVCPAGCVWDGQECRKHSGIIMPDIKSPGTAVRDGGP